MKENYKYFYCPQCFSNNVFAENKAIIRVDRHGNRRVFETTENTQFVCDDCDYEWPAFQCHVPGCDRPVDEPNGLICKYHRIQYEEEGEIDDHYEPTIL